jgi:hypothetical protein
MVPRFLDTENVVITIHTKVNDEIMMRRTRSVWEIEYFEIFKYRSMTTLLFSFSEFINILFSGSVKSRLLRDEIKKPSEI